MMGEASEAAVALLHEGGADGGGATGGSWVSGTGSTGSSGIGTASSGSSSSLFSSTTTWSVGGGEEDGDGATSSSRPADRRRHFSSYSSLSSLSSTSSESEAVQMNGAAAGGPLYGMSTMQDHLPPSHSRTGLSMYYKGRSESFTSLADVSCVEDLAKKTIPYIRRPKASRRHAAALGAKNRFPKTIAKKEPRGRKPAGSECHGKIELYR